MSDPLISTEALSREFGDPRLRLVDATWFLDGSDARTPFLRERLPGAVFFDIDAVADRASDLPHMLPSPDGFAAAVGALGIGSHDRVVVYDQIGVRSAPRVWWTFRVFGHDQVRVLDGGLPKWRAEGRPTEAGEPTPRPARFEPRFRPELVRDFEAVRRELAQDGQVLDARSAERFRGEAPEPRPGLRSGHMPGARNLPFPEVLNPDGTMKSAEDLRAAFARVIDPDRPVTATCGSGLTATILALALARLGRLDAAVYDGSWAEWGARADAEVIIDR